MRRIFRTPSPARGRLGALLLAVGGGLVACADGAMPGADALAVRDSAGVEIVENRAHSDSVPRWTLEPVLGLGSRDEEGPEQFFRLTAAARLPDGSLAALNSGSGEIRIFGPDGAFVRSMGGEGEGPGEFRFARGMWTLPGDSLLVWDYQLRRATVYAVDGGLGRIVSPDRGDPSYPAGLGVLDDGGLILADARFTIPESGFAETPVVILRLAPDGRTDSVSTHPLGEIGRLGEVGMMGAPLFAPATDGAALPDGYRIGTGKAYEVEEYDVSGRLRRLIRWRGPDRTVQPGDAERYRAWELSTLPEEQRPRQREVQANRPVAERFMAYREVLTATDGTLRVMRFDRVGGRPQEWLVFDRAHRLVAVLEMPANLTQPFEMGPDRVLGVAQDDLGVEFLRLYRVVRP